LIEKLSRLPSVLYFDWLGVRCTSAAFMCFRCKSLQWSMGAWRPHRGTSHSPPDRPLTS